MKTASGFPIVTAVALLLVPCFGWGGPALEQGATLLLENQPSQAVTYLEQAVREEPANTKAHLYLALTYEQLGLHTEAISTLTRALDLPGAKPHVLYFNMGNNYLHQGDPEHALDMYTKAIDTNRTYPNPYLNRANILAETEEYEQAIADYKVYLNLDPDTPQREAIERAIVLLEDAIEQERIRAEEERKRREEEERRKREEEERRRQEEERKRLEEERRRQEEEARRKALLDSVLDSLKESSEETQNLSAGSEDIEVEVEEDLDIAD